MRYGSEEYSYAAPFAQALVEDQAFRNWVLSNTEFASISNPRLLDKEMKSWRGNATAEWWRFHFTEKCRCAGCSGKETDILAIFESGLGVRFALHFEVKQPTDKFKSDGIQARGYPLRAQCWVNSPPAKVLPHHRASTALLFSEAKRTEFAPYLQHFKTHLTFEEIRRVFPDLVLGRAGWQPQ